MKKILLVLLATLLAIGMAACGAPVTQETPTTAPSTQEQVVVFTDDVLEDKIREAMGKPTGDITVAEAKTVVKLDLSNVSFDDMNSQNGGIRDISDLKYFTGLEELNLSYNDISDFTPLAELKSIKTLGFTGVRPKDLSALSGLTNMYCLVFDWTYAPDQGHNGYENLDFMSDMKDLEIFSAKGDGIKDITALGGLTKLWSLYLADNQITDISPLANLKNLKELELSKNPIDDFSPIKDVYPNLACDFELK